MRNQTDYPITFLCGPLRSGTTVLGLMFAHHPSIHAPGEYDFLFDYLNLPLDSTNKDTFIEQLQKDRVFNASGLEIDESGDPIDIIKNFIDQLNKNDNHLLINVHRNFDKITKIYPKSRFIHLKRDPRDVARSAIGMGWCGNVYYGVDYWLESERSWDRLVQKINPEQFQEVSFENLICNTKEELTRLCEFLDLEYDESMLSYPEYTTYSLPDTSLIYQWKRKQSMREIRWVESKLGSYLEYKGYEMSGYDLKSPNPAERVYLWMQNKFFQYRFGMKRYGLYLFMMEKLTRNLHFGEAHKRFIEKINAIDMLYLK